MGMEPFNAVSNLIFIVCTAVSAALLLRDWANLQANSKLVLVSLSVLIMLIGIGSAAFHFKPTHTTHALDLIPIGLFILLALISMLKKGFNLGWPIIVAIALAWLCTTALASTVPEFLAGSLIYVPTLILILLMAIPHSQYNRKLLAVFGFFGMGLLIRAIDIPLCDSFSFGTHWLWHVCTAVAALQSYLLILRICRTNDKNATASA